MLSIKDYYIESINNILPTWNTDEVKAIYSVISDIQERRKKHERQNHQANRKNRR